MPKPKPPERTAVEETAPAFTPRRGRPTAAQTTAIDQAIRDMARTMFLDIGYADTSMEELAARLGISKGTLYARYRNKALLFHAVIAERMPVWEASVAAEVPTDDRDDVGTVLFREGVRFLRGRSVPEVIEFERLIISEAARFPELVEEFMEQGYRPFASGLTTSISAISTRTDWPLQDVRSVVEVFTSALIGFHNARSADNAVDPETIAPFVARLVAIMVGGRAAW